MNLKKSLGNMFTNIEKHWQNETKELNFPYLDFLYFFKSFTILTILFLLLMNTIVEREVYLELVYICTLTYLLVFMVVLVFSFIDTISLDWNGFYLGTIQNIIKTILLLFLTMIISFASIYIGGTYQELNIDRTEMIIELVIDIQHIFNAFVKVMTVIIVAKISLLIYFIFKNRKRGELEREKTQKYKIPRMGV